MRDGGYCRKGCESEMNNRWRNKNKAIDRYCTKINMGGGVLYVPFNGMYAKFGLDLSRMEMRMVCVEEQQ